MKSLIFILLFSISGGCAAQEMKTFDTCFLNTTLKDFFSKNTDVEALSYFTNFQLVRRISVSFKKDTSGRKANTGNEYYNLNFIGDKYLFEKKYGTIDLPEKEIQKAITKKCFIDYNLQLAIKADSVKLKFKSYCPAKNDEERFFTKVEIFASYKPGMKQLEEYINAVSVKKYFPVVQSPLADSVFIFRVVVGNKDSCLKEIKLIYGKDCFFTQVITEALNNACLWTPSFQGGRAVNAYLKIYVALKADQSITVAYPETN